MGSNWPSPPAEWVVAVNGQSRKKTSPRCAGLMYNKSPWITTARSVALRTIIRAPDAILHPRQRRPTPRSRARRHRQYVAAQAPGRSAPGASWASSMGCLRSAALHRDRQPCSRSQGDSASVSAGGRRPHLQPTTFRSCVVPQHNYKRRSSAGPTSIRPQFRMFADDRVRQVYSRYWGRQDYGGPSAALA